MGSDVFSLQKNPGLSSDGPHELPVPWRAKTAKIRIQRNQSGFFFWNVIKTHRIHGTGIFTYIWLIFMVNVGTYTIHGWYGKVLNVAHLKLSVFR